jgi:uncharacterized protein YbjT (DUF2867 family)
MSEGAPLTRPRRVFIAGSTGATGRALLQCPGAADAALVLHRRPKPGDAQTRNAREVVFPLSDRDRLTAALRDCTTVVQLIGTTRQRFTRGDTYETSDIGTTRDLVEAGRAAKVDHFILLSSVGAGRPVGGYLQAKAAAERLVLSSGLPYTILRPSAFVGEGHHVPAAVVSLTKVLGLDSYRPIPIEDLGLTILDIALNRDQLGAVLQGPDLWQAVEHAQAHRSKIQGAA